jgi:glutamate 5-kinase
MRSKVLAAQLASEIGIRTVIAGGTGDAVLAPIVAGEQRGTSFAPRDGNAAPDSAFKLWLRHGKPARGRVQVDDGARRALLEHGASLLAVGVTGHSGGFVAGDAVELVGPDARPFAKGIVSASAHELAQRPRGLEVVHRDRLVLLDG